MPLFVSHSLVRSPEVEPWAVGCKAAALWVQQHREIFIG